MNTSTEINSIARIVGEEKAIELCAKAGFNAWDFSIFAMCNYDWVNKVLRASTHPLTKDNYLSYARKLKQIGLDNGIYCNQSHAPFPVKCKEIRSYLLRSIECTAEAGGAICIIHPDDESSPEKNAEMYAELLPFAKSCGVKIAAENMWGWYDESGRASSCAACSTPKNFCEHLDILNDDHLVACLDIGHAEMMGDITNAVEMIHALGNRLQALHVHDNDKWHDSHQIPFSMDIDFDAVTKALKDIGYRGHLTLEAKDYLKAFDESNVLDGVKNLANVARRLADMID